MFVVVTFHIFSPPLLKYLLLWSILGVSGLWSKYSDKVWTTIDDWQTWGNINMLEPILFPKY